MKLIEMIVSDRNLSEAITAVKRNKGAAGIDKMSVSELDEYFRKHKEEIVEQILQKKYKPQPVRRVYIPKPNGKQRPLGIPTVVDRVIQQAVAQILMRGYEKYFSESSYGFREGRSAHMAVEQVLSYLNEGYEWVIDLDIQKYFDTVNHDKLISILRERIKEAETLHLIRSFLRAGVMENGLVSPTDKGVPQGGPLSPILSNVYLDKLDRELEARGLRFARYADDCNIFVKSELAANRVMKSIVSWIERKLFLKVNAEKSKIVRPMKSQFLGFTFWKDKETWKCKPVKDRIQRLYTKVKEITCRKRAVAKTMAVTFTKLNQVIRGWINYFRIGSMKGQMKLFGEWMRHKVRVVIIKQWKNGATIYRNLQRLNKLFKCNIVDEDIFKVANSRLGWYKRSNGDVVNYLISPKVLAMKTKSRPGLVDPLQYYLSSL
ncbi:MAG: group II intron reverse transcriptase/maturase [Segatella copri]